MGLRAPISLCLLPLLTAPALCAQGNVFVVGEHTATAEVATDFSPTEVVLPAGHLNERGRRELERMLVAEQGFAHRALPLGPGLTLEANGGLKPGPAEYRHMLFEKGQSAAAGDRVIVTAMLVKNDRLVLDLNGGPYEKHRFLSHIQINEGNVVAPQEKATGSRVTLVFPHGVPDISAPEVKALLEPVIDFGIKSSEQAYADTLPVPLREAIAAHEVKVGMSHRMVLAALGQPDSKVRERQGENSDGKQYEEWIYGHVPQTVRFVRFVGDRVTQLEIAELGKPMVVHQQDEMGGLSEPAPTRSIQMGDVTKSPVDEPAAAPSLRLPGDATIAATNAPGKVQLPPERGGDPTRTAPADKP